MTNTEQSSNDVAIIHNNVISNCESGITINMKVVENPYKILTLDDLKAMTPNTIFASGDTNKPEMYNIPVKWIAIRGGIHDWAIYYHHAFQTTEWIRRHGDKLHDKAIIRELVPCSDEAFAMYRY